MDYGQTGQAQGQKASFSPGGYIAGATQAGAPPSPLTLVRAISMVDDLNKRLSAICSGTTDIAQAVGGPYPVSDSNSNPQTVANSAMQRLNEGIDNAHGTVTMLENALSAIRRALGA